MQKLAIAVAGVAVALFQVACSDSQPATAPRLAANTPAVADQHGGNARAADRVVSIQDACDGPSFAAQGVACSRNGGMKFDQFIANLTRNGSVGPWAFDPSNVTLKLGESFSAMNRGGETHTFTEVAHFGGGIVPILNTLSGNTVPAAECLALAPSDFLAPGGMTMPDTPDAIGTELYQCCIHPWMRAVVTVKRG